MRTWIVRFLPGILLVTACALVYRLVSEPAGAQGTGTGAVQPSLSVDRGTIYVLRGSELSLYEFDITLPEVAKQAREMDIDGLQKLQRDAEIKLIVRRDLSQAKLKELKPYKIDKENGTQKIVPDDK